MSAVDVVHQPMNHLHNRYYNPKPLISSSKNHAFMKSRSDFAPKPNPNPSVSGSPRRKQTSQNKKKSSTRTTSTSGSPRSTTSSISGGGGGSRYKSNSPRKNENSPLVPGKVKILKRGETLTDITASLKKENQVNKKDENFQKFDNGGGSSDLVVAGQILMTDFFAGSAITSPPPSSLPIPALWKKEKK